MDFESRNKGRAVLDTVATSVPFAGAVGAMPIVVRKGRRRATGLVTPSPDRALEAPTHPDARDETDAASDD